MDQTYKAQVIQMVTISHSPIILFDEKLDMLACSRPFRQCMIGFQDDIHSLFNANAIQRIKRARKGGKSIRIKTESSPFILSMSINWLSSGTDIPYLLGVIESNSLHDANRSLSIAYSCVDRSQRSLQFLRDQLTFLEKDPQVFPELLADLIHHAKILTRNHENLLDCVNLLTDELALNKKANDIVRIIRLSASHAQKKLTSRNIKIVTNLSRDMYPIMCDLKYFTRAICDCLYSVIYFTQDNHRILIDTYIQNHQCHILFTDPLFKIPDKYLERLFIDDIILPGSTDHAGLYFANAIIRKHGGSLEIDNTPALGYQLKITIPIQAQKQLVFEDIDDQRITDLILQYAEMELFDL